MPLTLKAGIMPLFQHVEIVDFIDVEIAFSAKGLEINVGVGTFHRMNATTASSFWGKDLPF